MPASNLTNDLAAVDFASLADVKAFWNPRLDDNSQDTLISSYITQVSERFTRYLGQHTLAAARTEDYELAPRTSTFSLTGANVDSGETFTLLKASRADLLGDATAEATTTYTVNYPSGIIRLYARTGLGLSYARVTYTAGLAASAAAMKTDYPDLHQACLMQCRYLIERRSALGSNMQSAGGGGSQFTTPEYSLLREVQDILAAYRRTPIL